MKTCRIILTLLIILVLFFTFSIPLIFAENQSNGNAYGHDMPQNPHYQDNTTIQQNQDIITTNYTYTSVYNDNDYSYNTDFYNYNTNYDYSYYNTFVRNTEVLKAINNISKDNLNIIMNEESNATLGIEYTDKKKSIVSNVYRKIDFDQTFELDANVYINPKKIVARLRGGEFCDYRIAVTADDSIILDIKSNLPNIIILTKEIYIIKNEVSYVNIQIYMKKGTYWLNNGKIIFSNKSGKIISIAKIIIEDYEAVDFVSRLTMDTNYTTVGIGAKQSRGSWGWGSFIGIKSDRHGNETIYGTLELDW